MRLDLLEETQRYFLLLCQNLISDLEWLLQISTFDISRWFSARTYQYYLCIDRLICTCRLNNYFLSSNEFTILKVSNIKFSRVLSNWTWILNGSNFAESGEQIYIKVLSFVSNCLEYIFDFQFRTGSDKLLLYLAITKKYLGVPFVSKLWLFTFYIFYFL